MKKFDMKKMARKLGFNMRKRSPEILVGVGIAGMITTAVIAVKATPKALALLEEAKALKSEENGSDEINLQFKETVMVTWKCYIPAVLIGSASVACIIGANATNLRRNAALSTAFTLSETAYSEYRDKVSETIGEKKEKAVRESIAKDKLDNAPIVNKEIILTEKGNTICYDAMSGRKFKSDIEALRQIENELNARMLIETYISLNDFYYMVGLHGTKMGDQLGWNSDDGLINIQFSSQLTPEGEPALVVDFDSVKPRYEYFR